jgi:hypothetical protein
VQRVGAVDVLRGVEGRAVLEEQLEGGEAGFEGVGGVPFAVEDVEDGGADPQGRLGRGFGGGIRGWVSVDIRVRAAF